MAQGRTEGNVVIQMVPIKKKMKKDMYMYKLFICVSICICENDQ